MHEGNGYRPSAWGGISLPFAILSLGAWVLLIWHIAHLRPGTGPQGWFLLAGGALDVNVGSIKLRVVVWNLLLLAGLAWLPLALARSAAAPFAALIGLGGALTIEPVMRFAYFIDMISEEFSTWPFDVARTGLTFFHTLLLVEMAVAFIAVMAIYRLLFRSRRARAVFFQSLEN
ncbi:MAG: hypothetical protein AAF409_15795 [Pseudomonadota bacterium]